MLLIDCFDLVEFAVDCAGSITVSQICLTRDSVILCFDPMYVSVIKVLSTVFHFISSPDNSPLSHSVLSGLFFCVCFFSALLVLSTIGLFMKVSLSPDIILCG